MNPSLAVGYTSRSQIARVVTEAWVASNLYCVCCTNQELTQSPNNSRAVDFGCDQCRALYQLKSGERWNCDRILDAGFDSMINAIRSDQVPNLLVLQYDPRWTVQNLMLVPSFFFMESAIQKRKPLGPDARRAGWIGCNILLRAIPPEGKIQVVANGVASDPKAVRDNYGRVRPIAKLNVGLRGWALNVLRIVHRIGAAKFALGDIYAYEEELAAIYPGNSNIRPKIRQQLQVLRDMGLIAFLGRGVYSLRS